MILLALKEKKAIHSPSGETEGHRVQHARANVDEMALGLTGRQVACLVAALEHGRRFAAAERQGFDAAVFHHSVRAGGIDDGPDTLDANPDCVRTWDDRVMHKGGHGQGPGMIDVFGSTLTFRVGVDELNPFLGLGDTVLIWTATKFQQDADRTPNIETGDGCAKPEVSSEVISLELN